MVKFVSLLLVIAFVGACSANSGGGSPTGAYYANELGGSWDMSLPFGYSKSLTSFCNNSARDFWGSYGRAGFMWGSISADGKTARGFYAEPGVNPEGHGIFEIFVDEVEAFAGNRTYARSGAIDEAAGDRTEVIQWAEPRSNSGGSLSAPTFCMGTYNSSRTSLGFQGKWQGAAKIHDDRERGLTYTWYICDSNVDEIYGALINVDGQVSGIFSARTDSTGNVAWGTWETYEADSEDPNQSGDILLRVQDDYTLYAFLWLGNVHEVSNTQEEQDARYLGTATLIRPSSQALPEQIRLCERYTAEFEAMDKDSASLVSVSALLLSFIASLALLF